MKNTLRNSALLSAAVMALGSTASVFAAETAGPSNANSTGKIEFNENDQPTNPLDPTDPSKPLDPDPNDPDNKDNGGTKNKGPLSLDYVSNLNFGKANINTATKTFNAKQLNPFVQISDSRATGNWHLTAKMSKQFTNENGGVLTGAKIHWMNGKLKSPNAALLADTANLPELATDIVVDDSNEVNFMNYAKEAGKAKGTWLAVFAQDDSSKAAAENTEDLGTNTNVQLEVPANVATAGKYSADITWQLLDGIAK